MVKKLYLGADDRDFSVSAKQLRRSGKVPATVYGKDFSPISVQMDVRKFKEIYKGDKTAIINLMLKDESLKVLVKNLQQDPRTFEIQNLELYKINSDSKVKIQAPVELVGTAPAVKAGGALWNPVTEVEIECLPDNIPENIKVDISALENFEDSITINDVNYPEGVEPIAALESIIVKVNAPRSAKLEPMTSQDVSALTKS